MRTLKSKPCVTHPELLERLKNLRPASAEELKAQRRSYLRAEAGFGSDADEAAYRQALSDGDTAKIAELDEAAERRMESVDTYLSPGDM
tara:strand:+ start:168 stop:434 length:267 start_codon:yes stop_codon:yes gene_type:complete